MTQATQRYAAAVGDSWPSDAASSDTADTLKRRKSLSDERLRGEQLACGQIG